MTRTSRPLLLMLLLAACSSATPASNAGDSGGTVDLRAAGDGDLGAGSSDLSIEDVKDLAPAADLARSPDLQHAGCTTDKECRLYSNTCAAIKPNPCICIPLPARDPDPPCMGPRVLCDVDPCDGKQPACDLMTGRCFAH